MTIITTDHIKAMRRALSSSKSHNIDTWVCVDWRIERDTADGKFAFEVAQTIDHGEGHEPRSTRRSVVEVFCDGEINVYSARPTFAVARYVATDRVHYFERRASVLRSLCNTLRAGDQLYVHFVIGNTTQSLEGVSFGRDECYVSIRRKNQCVATFHVDTIVSPVDGWSMRDTIHRFNLR